MKKIFTLLLSLCICTWVMAQRPEAVIKKAGEVKPAIDGVLDDVWTAVEQHNVDKPFGTEKPSLGEEGTTFWKALWDDAGLYIIVVANDDIWYPYSGTGNSWEFDKIELYFDTNYVLEDGAGGQAGATGNRQIAPDYSLTTLDGELKTQTILGGDIQYAYKVENPKWTTEWFIPWESIPDKDGNIFDKTGVMGFDVSLADNDNDGLVRKRAVWSNVGTINENWSNMDDAGHITLDGVGEAVDIDGITVSGGSEITTDNGTLQLTATVAPANATQGYKWIVTNETGMATISKTGLVTAQRNGTVKVTAISANDFVTSNEFIITISGQRISLAEINILKNSNFTLGSDGKESWGGAGIVEDSYYNLECTAKTNIWDTMFGQGNVNVADATTKYIVKFKAKGSADMSVPTLFEDRNNGNDKVVSTSAPYRDNSYGKWDVPVTTEEQWFEFDVTFSNKKDNSAYELNFQAGLVSGTFSIDSIMMYKESDFALVDPTVGAKTINANSIKVYPNPVGKANQITVNLVNVKGNIAIYNSVGQKVMEKSVTGNSVRFDVSGLQKGLYFVKTSDGATQKFIR